MPFILRSVSLRGVDSVSCPVERRKVAWQRLVSDLPGSTLDEVGQVAGLEDIPALAEQITTGRIRGRVIVDPHR
jgi:acrylyl-CoA reductase (NADPH)